MGPIRFIFRFKAIWLLTIALIRFGKDINNEGNSGLFRYHRFNTFYFFAFCVFDLK